MASSLSPSIFTFHLHSFHTRKNPTMYVTIHSARTHMWTLLTYANDWNLKVNFPYLCFDWAEVTFLSCTHITSDQSKRRCKGKATLWPVPCTAPCQCHCTIIQYVPNKVYHDSEPQCVVGRQMGQLAMQCMLIVLLFSCKSRTHIPYIYLCVGSTAPSLDILL